MSVHFLCCPFPAHTAWEKRGAAFDRFFTFDKKTLHDFSNHAFTGKSHRTTNYIRTRLLWLRTPCVLLQGRARQRYGLPETLPSPVRFPLAPSQRSLQPGRAVCARTQRGAWIRVRSQACCRRRSELRGREKPRIPGRAACGRADSTP